MVFFYREGGSVFPCKWYYWSEIFKMYKKHTQDEFLFIHMSMIANQLDIIVKHLKKEKIPKENLKEILRNLEIIPNTIVRYVDLVEGKITRNAYLKEYLARKPYLQKRIPVNSLCPCGSGKKYKSCCK